MILSKIDPKTKIYLFRHFNINIRLNAPYTNDVT